VKEKGARSVAERRGGNGKTGCIVGVIKAETYRGRRRNKKDDDLGQQQQSVKDYHMYLKRLVNR